MRRTTGRLGAGLGIGIAAAALALILFPILHLERAELSSFDLRLRWRPGVRPTSANARVLIAALDARSLRALPGRRWPVPRSEYARLVRFLSSAGASCLGFDLLFEEPHPGEDERLAQALRAAGNAYLGVGFVRSADPFEPVSDVGDALENAQVGADSRGLARVRLQMKGARLPPPVLRRAACGLGSVTVLPEVDGVVRRYPLVVAYVRPGDDPPRVRWFASLPLLMAADVLGVPVQDVRVRLGDSVQIGSRRIPIDENGEMVIHYYGPYRSIHHLSYTDIVAGAYEPRYFRNRPVLLGSTYPGGFDLRTTPYGGDYPGVEVQAAVLQNLLDGSAIRRLPEWTGLLATLACGLLVGVFRARGLRWQVAAALGLGLGWVVAACWLLAARFLWVEMVRPLLGVFLAWLGVSVSTFLEEQSARARVQGAVDALAEMTLAIAHTHNPGELRDSLEAGIARVLESECARLHIHDPRLQEWLPARTDAGTGDLTAGQVAPMLLHGKEVGYLALRPAARGTSPALVSAVTTFAAMALESAVGFEESRDFFFNLTMMLADIIESNDPYTAGHCARVMEYACAIGERLGLSDVEMDDLRYAALLHDVGKATLDRPILNKPGALTPDEMREVRRHPALGRRWLQRHRRLHSIADLVATHHERWDGTGYPDGLSGGQIPLGGRILAAADVWDALTTDRPYRRALTFNEARAYVERGAGSQFDPAVVAALLDYLDTIRGEATPADRADEAMRSRQQA